MKETQLIGKYVICRCTEAGVHAGVLEAFEGQAAILSSSRRLWYWKPRKRAAYLSGVAVHGVEDISRLGEPITVALTEVCEVILVEKDGEKSLRRAKSYEN